MKGVYKAATILFNVWPEQTDIQWEPPKCKYCYTTFVTVLRQQASGRQYKEEIQLTFVIIRGKDWDLEPHNSGPWVWLTWAFIQP